MGVENPVRLREPLMPSEVSMQAASRWGAPDGLTAGASGTWSSGNLGFLATS